MREGADGADCQVLSRVVRHVADIESGFGNAGKALGAAGSESHRRWPTEEAGSASARGVPCPGEGASLVRVTAQGRGSLGGSPGNDDGTHRPVDAVEVPLGRGAGQST